MSQLAVSEVVDQSFLGCLTLFDLDVSPATKIEQVHGVQPFHLRRGAQRRLQAGGLLQQQGTFD